MDRQHKKHTAGGAHLSLKDMAQVAAALCACDLHAPHAIGVVHMALNCPGNLCIECRPPASGVKLGLGPEHTSNASKNLQCSSNYTTDVLHRSMCMGLI